MAMKINGIDGSFPVPRVIGSYTFVRFEKTMTALVNGVEKTVDIKDALTDAWSAVTRRSKGKPCNEYFTKLRRGKSLADVLGEGDIVFHCLEPKAGKSLDNLPNANTAGRDIGLNPYAFFDPEADALACTLIHELAHVAGASTNPAAEKEEAHAAELSLKSCQCSQHYNEKILGRIRFMGFGEGDRRYA